ncbi:DNA-binding protein [Streptosporangium jomthongense]|uniref:Conserved phage C-terminal domain-containing protein n=1 Tax=Marinobacter aromaticivorans TaxID=1494078 RepID=A0ABW2IY88_9GAMM|nr:conserved phage C-terminal domain-containing protein [Marinobacter aromaticivorans]GGE75807.1 DNA-binding protein [Streptosporangium jomthongense]
MSLMLMAQAFGAQVGNAARKLVLLKLADNANDQGECWPSYQYIADQCEISRRSAMDHIEELCKSGLIQKRSRKGPKGNATNIYIVTLGGEDSAPDGENIAPPSENSAPPSETVAPPPSENSAPGISHSFESVSEPVSEPKDLVGKPDISAEVIEYLNRAAGRNFRPVQASIRLIRARAKEGATLSDFKAVIDRKCAEWARDPRFSQYLRPATLFNAEKFNNYLGQLNAPMPAKSANDRPRHSGFSEIDYSKGLKQGVPDGVANF